MIFGIIEGWKDEYNKKTALCFAGNTEKFSQ